MLLIYLLILGNTIVLHRRDCANWFRHNKTPYILDPIEIERIFFIRDSFLNDFLTSSLRSV